VDRNAFFWKVVSGKGLQVNNGFGVLGNFKVAWEGDGAKKASRGGLRGNTGGLMAAGKDRRGAEEAK